MDFLHFVDRLPRSVDLGAVVVVVLVEAVVFLVAVIWAGVRKKKRIEAQILLDDDRRLAQRIQSQQAEIEMLKQQLGQLKHPQITLAEDELMSRRTRQTYPPCESIRTHELREAEIAQRDDTLEDFVSERYNS
jgi:hypothetical protein